MAHTGRVRVSIAVAPPVLYCDPHGGLPLGDRIFYGNATVNAYYSLFQCQIFALIFRPQKTQRRGPVSKRETGVIISN